VTTEKRPKKTIINRKDWRNIPYTEYNVATFHSYFIDMNREMYGSEYAPMRNWKFEQGVLKRAIDAHGPVILRQAFDVCFRTYTPTREYPLLTAGFAVAYRVNAIIPRLKAEQAEKDRRERERAESDANKPSADDVIAWL
jgi:hypothetical protein